MYAFVKNVGSTTPHPWLRMITTIVLVLANGKCCHGCWEQERIALLHLKTSINDSTGSSLPSWVDDRYANCCQWEAIECSNNSKRVIQISLVGKRDWRIGNYVWHFNASLFLPFEELKILNLSGNGLIGWVDNEGFQRLLMSINLEVLDLSDNLFNDTILKFVRKISYLRSLYLASNNMGNLIDLNDFRRLSNLINLKVLDLSYNYFSNSTILEFVGKISSLRSLYLKGNYLGASVDLKSFRRLSRLSNLEFLDLSDNNLNNNILTSIGGISSLKFLDLSSNLIKGSIDINSLCKLKTLQELNIGGNELQGTLPWCLANLTSLRLLDISSNYFHGNIASSSLVNLTTLKYLVLSDNQFEVPVSFKSFLNHSKLKVLESLNNTLVAEREYHSSTPSFQLAAIRLSDPKTKNCSVGFPHFLYHQNELQVIELSQIHLNRKWLNWLFESNSRLVSLAMRDNSLHGSILDWLPLNPIIGLSNLDISNNHIEGYIPHKLGSIFPNLLYLDMSTNGFKGDIPSSLGELTSLKVLDLSNNQLSGKIPVHLVVACESLVWLILSNNNLTGPILPLQTNLGTIEYLLLDNNHFTQIPDSLSINSLFVLKVGHNQLAGNIPGWIWNLSSTLQILSLSNNNFEGPIPLEFCELGNLNELDLSNNYFTGIVPSCFSNLSKLENVWLSNNRLSGPFPEVFQNSLYLRVLDLSNNRLSNDIPAWIGGLFYLRQLLLKNNNFEGNIPNQVCDLRDLTVIDLSWNNFSGHIPHCLCTNKVEIYYSTPTDLYMHLKLTLSFDDFQAVLEKPKFYYSYKFLAYTENHMEFTTKGRSLTYKGVPLDLFSAIDLSNNKLNGCIPPEIGYLSHIKSLSLSHNNLTGPIPATFSNLESIESLDLSYNNLQGNIPYELTGLHFLENFNVSYNNLSGRIPQGPNQFHTFDGSSYIGNPHLFGEKIPNSCNSPLPTAPPNNGSEVGFSFIDMGTFYMSFAGSYLTMLLVIVGILYINPYWRQVWFHFVKIFITSCYYFVMDNLWKIEARFLHKRSPV